jgi:hypothetical protein
MRPVMSSKAPGRQAKSRTRTGAICALGIANAERRGIAVRPLARPPGALKGVVRLGLGRVGDTARQNWRESSWLIGVCETAWNHLAGGEKSIARGRPGHRRVLSPWRLATGESAQDPWSDKKGGASGHLSTI